MQVVEKVLAVFDKMQVAGQMAFAQRVLGQQTIVRVVVGHQDYDWFARGIHAATSALRCFTGNMTVKVAPSPNLLLALIVPPWRSVMRRQTARPTPVPAYSSRPCNR